ncbi:MAG: hypothetical protein ABIX28_25230 [Vicinamibacterales bacterium]
MAGLLALRAHACTTPDRGIQVMRHTRSVVVAALAFAVAAGAFAVANNPAPEVAGISAAEVTGSTQPYVVKLHARWCLVCMVTKDVWSEVQAAYTGRVRFVVFDFTTDATTEAGRAEAQRLGLDEVFEEYAGVTGSVLVLDGVSKELKHELYGSRNLAEYQAAIDLTIAQRRE